MNDRRNNFGLLRLMFAALVILSHSPEMMDGNRARELATRLWGTLSFGEIAVDGFFLVSGYLIAQSFENTRSVGDYLAKRVLRIYPAFLVATAVVVLLLAPTVGAVPWTWREGANVVIKALTLEQAKRAGTFEGLHYPLLDGAMWTIAYEFRCYLMVILLGRLGLLRRPAVLAALALLLLFGASLEIVPQIGIPPLWIYGNLRLDARLSGVFVVGTLFYALRGRFEYRNEVAGLIAILLFGLMFWTPAAEPALAVLGGYLVFWFAFLGGARRLSAKLTDDVSYGLYLYGWPVANTLIFFQVFRSPWAVAVATLFGAALCGFASWRLVEEPCLRLKPRRFPEIAGDTGGNAGELVISSNKL